LIRPPSAERHPERTLYGRRHGRALRRGRAEALQHRLPRCTLKLPAEGRLADWRAAFPRRLERLWLEVGFGNGEHLAAQAAMHPATAFIGCEPFVNGISALLARLDEEVLDRVRVHPGDAREVLAALPDGAVDRCFVLFPDPWPKRRHQRRRFVQADTLAGLARVIADGGLLILATDHPALLDWMLCLALGEPAFEWTARRAADWRTRPADMPPTRYEKKALHGRPTWIVLSRRPRTDAAPLSS
jgi:tRNA (guanine-N7-)-methyltransferase